MSTTMHASTGARTGVGPIGLDIGARSIHAVQVRHEAGKLGLHAAVSVARLGTGCEPSAAEMARLLRVLGRQGFEGSGAVVGLPGEKLLSNTFEQVGQGPGGTGGAPMDVVSRVELARSAGCAPPQLETVCWPLPAPARARQSTHVLAVGCLHSEADPFLDVVESAGLRAVALEPRAVALGRACERLLERRQGICAIVDAGWEGATAAVLYRGVIVYHRFMPELGAGALLRAMTTGMGTEEAVAEHLLMGRSALPGPEEGGPRIGLRADAAQLIGEHASKLAHELSLSLSYASHWYADPQVEFVLLSGEGAAMPGLGPALARELGADVRLVGAWDVVAESAGAWRPITGAGAGGHGGGGLMTALGLAMR